MKKKIFIFIIPTMALLVIVSSFVFAWYTRTFKKQIDNIEINANGVTLEYEINSDTDKNTVNCNVTGLAFFDINNPGEAYYFTTMAIKVNLKIKNVGTGPVDITIEQLGEYPTNAPYVASVIYEKTGSELDSKTDANKGNTVDSYLEDEKLTNKLTLTNKVVDKDNPFNVIIYLYGVQPDDTAINDDFLKPTDVYEYSFKISAIKHVDYDD